jgi:Flp pilus assembly protein TadD
LMGETQKAQAAYRAAMELDPSNMNYESNLGLSLALNGEPQEGIRILERVARMPSASPRARQNLALAYGLSGDMEMARRMGRADLSDEVVRGNLNYIRSVREMSGPSNRYVNVLPVSREESTFDVSRTWVER